MNTKTKMRLLSLLLCFVMMVGLLPTTAFAADEIIVDPISATVTLPTAGAHPVETGTPGDSSYDIIRIRFSKKDADSGVLTSLEPSDTFEAGATYRINVLFRAKNGFTIEREAKATINGMEAEYWSTIADGYGSQYFGLEYTVPEKITSISVTVPEPVAGEKADTNGITINPAALSVSSAKWYINKDGVGLVSVDKFTAGKTYYLVIKYDVAEGYTVSNSAAISHDLTDGEIAHNSSNKTIMIEYTVAVQAPITYTVSFDANGGSGTMADVTGISGEYTLPACTFTPPAGKQFKCWRVDGSEKMAGDKINVAEDMVVYAVWKDTVYDRTEISTVVAESDGGNITPVYGTATDDNPVFTVTTGSPAYCSTVMCGWRKHDGEHYVLSTLYRPR